MNRFAIALMAAILACLPLIAYATVQPPEEWLISPQRIAQWEAFQPTLLDWEFEVQKLPFGKPLERAQGIEQFMGQYNEDIAARLGLAKDDPELLKYDTDRNGQVDHFDLLELGYEVRPAQKTPSTAPSSGTNQWCVIRADFPGHSADYDKYTVGHFTDMFFTDGAAKPSCHDYYNEISYGALSIDGLIAEDGQGGDGWYLADNSKTWYENNGGRLLVIEMIYKADDEIDYSQFDVDGDGYVDSLILFYPNTVFNNGLHPHRSSGMNISVDGVIIDSYFLSGYNASNDSWTMTISTHEYGHILGLPDLYDTNGGSAGCGKWACMAYQYDNSHKVPSMTPWCKIQLGWLDPVIIRENVTDYSLDAFQEGPDVLKVWTNGQHEDQYFLIANQQKIMTDSTRPGGGLMIWHIDDSRTTNRNENRKLVDVECARGFDDPDSATGSDPLDANTDKGHSQDPFYSGNAHANYTGEFSAGSNPHSKSYPHPWGETYVKISNISASGNTMTFDIEVESPNRPTAVITSPDDDSDASADLTVEVDATAVDGRSIDRVNFFVNGAYFGFDSTSPYSRVIDSRAVYDGDREIIAIAVDNEGEEGSDSIMLNITNDGVSIPYSEDFEGGITAWAPYDQGGYRSWGATSISYEGNLAAGIGSSNGYDYNEHDSLVSIKLDLTSATNQVMVFRQRYRVVSGENTCKVLVTDDEGVTFNLESVFTGNNLTWHPQAVDLSDYAGSSIRVIFKLEGTSINRIGGTEGGWWIDNVEFDAYSDPPSVNSITPGEGYDASGIITIEVDATDDVGVTAVEFIINSTDLIFTDYETPFEFDWNSDWVFDGSHTFTAIAYDADMQSDSMTVNWTTSNGGLTVPWADSFNDEPSPTWRIIDFNGGGEWHRLDTGGYDDGPFMRFSIPGNSEHDNLDNDWLLSPTFDLAGATDPLLHFYHKYDLEEDYDYAYIYATTDFGTWDEIAAYSLYDQGWALEELDFSAYIGDTLKVAFMFDSDTYVTAGGWWVDALQFGPPPVITSSDPAEAVNGEEVDIIGRGFGPVEGPSQRSITVGGIEPTVVSWNHDSITIVTPDDIGTSDVVVTAYGRDSNAYSLTIKLPPPDLDDLTRR